MIVLGIYLHHDVVNNVSVFEENSFVVEQLIDDCLDAFDWECLNNAIMELDTDGMKWEEYWRLTFKRQYQDDGSGYRRELYYELVSSEQIINDEKPLIEPQSKGE